MWLLEIFQNHCPEISTTRPDIMRGWAALFPP